MRPYDLIAKKRDGGEHTPEEIGALVRAVTDGAMPDYQAAAWLMAAYLRGLSPAETLALTQAIRDSGKQVRWEGAPGVVRLDKHSTGGVGDKTTLVVVPLLAAAGVPVLKMSGRGLGFTGGTIDKLEAIPGFRAGLSVEEATAQVERVGAALVGQSPSLVPADKKIYALRDVTATVESIPLIAASIMSKKLAGGADAVLLDVKVGRGAFMKTLKEARKLARAMVEIGRGAGVRTEAVLTDMEEPLGTAVGNALEVAEACAVLAGAPGVDARFRALCMALAARGLVMAGKAGDEAQARAETERLLDGGAAAGKFAEILAAQGCDPEVVSNPERLPCAPVVREVPATVDGFVSALDAEAVGRLAMAMGAGRAQKEDTIDPAVGIVLRKKSGDPVQAGETLADLHLRDGQDANAFSLALRQAYAFSNDKPPVRLVIHEIVV